MYKYRKKISLHDVVVFVVVFTMLLSIIVSSSFLYSRFSVTISHLAQTTTEQSIGNITQSMDNYVSEMVNVLYSVSDIIGVTNDKEDSEEKLIDLYNYRGDLEDIVVYDKYGNILLFVTKDGRELKPNYRDINLSFVKTNSVSETSQMWDSYFCTEPHIDNLFYKNYNWVVTLIKAVNSPTYGKVFVTMDVSFDKISKYIDSTSIGNQGYAYIANTDGKIIYHPQQQVILSNLKEENAKIVFDIPNKSSIVSNRYIYAKSRLQNANWYVVGVSYIDDLVRVTQMELVTYMVFVLFIGIIVAILMAYIFSNGLGRPMNQLIREMKKFEIQTEKYQKANINGFSEITQISESFDHMAKKIVILLERIKNEEKELRKVELKALQAQINPHFLYNTLDSILWMCKKNENEKAAKMVEALANLFRISISRGKDLITIEQEIIHIKSYLIIQSIRYKNQFEYEFDIDEEILHNKCLKIMLQPFVENAIYHGIDRMVDQGLITITGHKHKEYIEFCVCDDGIGMSQEQIGDLFANDSETAGVGVKNVHNRIQIYFGEEYGINIESELDEGTKIYIKIPIIEEKY